MSFFTRKARAFYIAFVLLLSFVVVLVGCTIAQSNTNRSFIKIADDFYQLLGIVHAGDSSERLFLVERHGFIHVIDKNGNRSAEPFLDLSEIVLDDRSEQGLLGLAFHPDYETNGRFFRQLFGRRQWTSWPHPQ